MKQKLCTALLGIFAATTWLHPLPCTAEDTPKATISQDLQQEYDALLAKDPNNLDAFFSLANHAAATQDFDLSARALEYMLSRDASLSRVKLDLGMIYIKTKQYQAARTLFEDVKASNPPEPVLKNIEQALATLTQLEKKHVFTGSVTVGYNHDSNANSASSNGQVTFNDVNIPLEGSSTSKRDGQGFVAAGVNHTYRFPNQKTEWQNSVNVFRTEQANLDSLDLAVISARTGLTHAMNEQIKAITGISYSYIELDGFEYLNVTSVETGMDYQATQQLMFAPRLTFEHRDFVNSPTATTYTERSGNAYQARVDARYILNDKNMLNIGFGFRVEGTQREYNDNWQFLANAGHTYLLTPETFLNTNLNYRFSDYGGPDAFVSATRTRQDSERGLGITLGHSFVPSLVGTVGYQYRNVSSNIQNYAYDNHRVGATITKQFE